MHDEDIIKAMKRISRHDIGGLQNLYPKGARHRTDLHLAIVDDNDIYMGTVSLKHITNQSAERAIILRSCALGKDTRPRSQRNSSYRNE